MIKHILNGVERELPELEEGYVWWYMEHPVIEGVYRLGIVELSIGDLVVSVTEYSDVDYGSATGFKTSIPHMVEQLEEHIEYRRTRVEKFLDIEGGVFLG